MSTVILPLFHFKVAQCGIYSKTTAFRRLLQSGVPPPLSRKALNFKWLEYRCQAICISAQHQKHLKVETLDGVLCAQALTFPLKGKLPQTNSPHSLSHIHYIHFHVAPTLTFPLLSDTHRLIFTVKSFSFCRARCVLCVCHKQQKETCLGVINPHLFGLFTLTFPHISLPLFFLSVHTALTLSASLTCWQQFVSRYQFSVSRLVEGGGARGCGNHLHLRLLGSVPLSMLADTCHWAAVRQRGCGMRAQAAQVTVISFQKPLKLKP